MGLVILGDALTTHPVLSAEETWHWTDFNAKDMNQHWNEFQLGSEHIGHVRPEELINNLEFVVSTVQDKILELVDRYPRQIVAGTVRLCVGMAAEQTEAGVTAKINLWLMWAKHMDEE
jgi:hypothetical protein